MADRNINVGFQPTPDPISTASTSEQTGEQMLFDFVGDAVRTFQTERLGERARQDVETAGNLAENVVSLAEEQGLDMPSAAEAFDDSSMSPSHDAEDGFLGAQRRARKRAKEIFSVYKERIRQGAGNRTSAQIAAQQKVNELTRQNPAFADVISQEASSAFGDAQFQLNTRELDPPEETEYQKARREAAVNAQHFMNARGINPDSPEGRQFMETSLNSIDLEFEAELLEREAEANSNIGSLRRNVLTRQVGMAQHSAANKAMEALSQIDPATLTMEDRQELVDNLRGTMANARAEFITEMAELESRFPGQDYEDVNRKVDAAFKPMEDMITLLEDESTDLDFLKNELGRRETAGDLGVYEMFPTAAAMQNVFGDNMTSMLRLMRDPESAVGRMAFITMEQNGTMDMLRASNPGLDDAQALAKYIEHGSTVLSDIMRGNRSFQNLEHGQRDAAGSLIFGAHLEGDQNVANDPVSFDYYETLRDATDDNAMRSLQEMRGVAARQRNPNQQQLNIARDTQRQVQTGIMGRGRSAGDPMGGLMETVLNRYATGWNIEYADPDTLQAEEGVTDPSFLSVTMSGRQLAAQERQVVPGRLTRDMEDLERFRDNDAYIQQAGISETNSARRAARMIDHVISNYSPEEAADPNVRVQIEAELWEMWKNG